MGKIVNEIRKLKIAISNESIDFKKFSFREIFENPFDKD